MRNVTDRRAPHSGATESLVWLLPGFLAPLIVYLPVVLTEYGFSESYRLLVFYDGDVLVRPLLIAEGRPFFALWAKLAFGGLHGSIHALAAVRLFNLLALGAATCFTALLWRRAGLDRFVATCAAIAVFMLPTFQLFAGTAGMGGAAVAAALAAAAAWMTPADEADRPAREAARATAPALLVLIVAMTTYQSSALMYFAFAAVQLFGPELDRRQFRTRLATFAGAGGIALAVAFAVHLAGKSLYAGELSGTPRSHLAFEPMAKLAWFFGLPLSHAASFWTLKPSFALVPLLLLLLSVGLALRLRASDEPLLRTAVAFCLLPLCYLPNFVVSENHSSFRSQPALATLVIVYYMILLASLLDGPLRRVRPLAFAALAAAAAYTANEHVRRFIVTPQARELAIVREELGRLPDTYATIGIRASSFRDAIAPAVYYDEFGFPSTGLPWSFGELAWLVLRERRTPAAMAATRLVDVNGSAEKTPVFSRTLVPPDTIIDWGVILRAKRDADPVRR